MKLDEFNRKLRLYHQANIVAAVILVGLFLLGMYGVMIFNDFLRTVITEKALGIASVFGTIALLCFIFVRFIFRVVANLTVKKVGIQCENCSAYPTNKKKVEHIRRMGRCLECGSYVLEMGDEQ